MAPTLALLTTLLDLHRLHDPADVLPVLTERLGADAPALAVCYLPTDDGDALTPHWLTSDAATGDLADLDLPASLALADVAPTLAAWATANPESLFGQPAAVLAGFWPERTLAALDRLLPEARAVVAPVTLGGDVGGVVVLLVGLAWSAAEASDCATHAAAAIGRLESLRRTSRRDDDPFAPATFQQIAEREVSRAGRYGRVFALAVFAPAGGEPLPPAAPIGRLIRGSDLAGYLDDGRVAVLLPETGSAGARVFVQRVTSQLAGSGRSVTGGWAVFPDDGQRLADLLDRASDQRQDEAERRPSDALVSDGSSPDATAATETEGAIIPMRVRLLPIAETEVEQWRALLGRLPSVVTAERLGFDSFALSIEVGTRSVARLLSDLHDLANRLNAELRPSITGEVGLVLPSAQSRPRMRLEGGGDADSTEARSARRAAALAARPNRPWVHAVAAVLALTVLAISARNWWNGSEPPALLADAEEPTTTPATPGPAPITVRPFTRIERDLSGRCLPEPGQGACDATRAGLWAGDPATWNQWQRIIGGPQLVPSDVMARTMAMRLAAGDPATRVDLARGAVQPLLVISAVELASEAGAPLLVRVELANLGTAPAPLTGLRVAGLSPSAAAATLAPAGRVTLGEPPTAGGASAEGTTLGAPLPADGLLRLLTADGAELDRLSVETRARP